MGQEAPYLEEVGYFLEYVRAMNTPLDYRNPCPKKGSSKTRNRYFYLKYMYAKSHFEARELVESTDDI
jgi:hypothetical protein